MSQYKLKSNNTLISLDQKNFKASGGEADIYVKSNLVYKICHPGKMIPERKIKELQTLTNDKIITPKDILLDKQGREVGYTMSFVPDSYVWCQLFTKAFKERNKVDPKDVFQLVRQMQTTLNFIHSCHILVVDFNEFNFLVSQNFKQVFFIDVNSYQTPSFPAQVIMDSVRDRQGSKHSRLSDWFSFAIITFAAMIGIHPYKGKHGKYKTLDERMLNNVSVLNSTVSYPKGACYEFSVIPSLYFKWYEALFEKGMRLPPPENLVDSIRILTETKVVKSDEVFIITKIENRESDIIHYDFKNYLIKLKSTNNIVEIVDNLKVNTTSAYVNLPAQAFMLYQNRLYLKCRDRIDEVLFNDKLKSLVYTSKVSDCLEYATKLWDGCALENIFSDWFALIFPKTGQCQQIKLKELYQYKVVDAKFNNNILKIIGVKQGKYDKHTYTITDNNSYNYNCISDIVQTGLNFTVLDNGMCIEIESDGEMVLTREGQKKVVQSQQISANWRLDHIGNQVIFTENGETYNLGMK